MHPGEPGFALSARDSKTTADFVAADAFAA
jgi:hypothetical protein